MTKRHDRAGRVAVFALLVLLLVCIASAALAIAYPYNSVTTDKVNLREKASSNSGRIAEIPSGASVTVLEASGNFYKVTYGEKTGYVMKQYISSEAVSTIAPTPQPEASGYPYDTVTNAEVNLRAEKKANAQKLATIPAGATVTVLKISGTYAQVQYKGQEGWLKHEFIVVKKIVKPTPTPTPVVTLAPWENEDQYVTLQKGSSGTKVATLQSALIELGFLSGKADGEYGKSTENAVLALQAKNDYPTTGIADANLQAFIFNGTPKNSAGKATKLRTLPPVEGVTITLNNRGELVVRVQTRLKELGYFTGEISGTYDKSTIAAVRTFQKKNGLKGDGACTAETQQLLLYGDPMTYSQTPTPKPTASPTPVPTFEVPAKTVRKGSTGNDALLVQKRLKELGYLTGKTGGTFDNDDVKALKAFQTKHGLEADGVAGAGTYAVLFSVNALKANQKPTAAPTEAPTPVPTAVPTAPATWAPLTRENAVLIKLDIACPEVVRLQERLTELGYYTATVDGVCKADDVAAIKAFQKKNGLKADGAAGYETQVKLYSASAIAYDGTVNGNGTETYTTLKSGMSGAEVQTMQDRLVKLGYLEKSKADGSFGSSTKAAVKAFQKQNGLKQDGVAGSGTLSLLYSAAAATPAPTAKPTATPAPTAKTTLTRGDRSDAVKSMQEKLIALGYLTGKADGNFGLNTYRALLAFQSKNKLKTDGIAGAQTLELLKSSNAVPANATPTPVPNTVTVDNTISASKVRYANWYTTVKAVAQKYQYVTVYDIGTGITWQEHIFSFGHHAEAEPVTANDTARMERVFGGNTWNPRPVWVLFSNGSVYLGSTHSMPHETYHIKNNNFEGHTCIHFPRTAQQVADIGPYATSHQQVIDEAWEITKRKAQQ